MRKLKLGRGFALVAAAFTGLVGIVGASSAAERNWKMHIVWVPSRPEAQAYQAFVDKVNVAAGDRLKITLFTGGSLGVKDVDMLRVLPRGTVIQAAGLYPGYMTRDEPQLGSVLPPGVVSNPDQLKELLPELHNIYGAAYERWGIKLLGFVGHAVRDSHILCKEPVTSLEQLKTKKLRVWEQFHVDVFKRLGIAAQVIGQNDLYMAMQTGVVDCAVYPIGLAVTVSLQEVAPYASYLFPYVLNPLTLIVAKKSFDELPADLQSNLERAAKEVETESFASYLSGENDRKALEVFTAGNGKLLDPFPEADQKKFAEVAREVWMEMATSSGEEARKNYEILSKIVR